MWIPIFLNTITAQIPVVPNVSDDPHRASAFLSKRNQNYSNGVSLYFLYFSVHKWWWFYFMTINSVKDRSRTALKIIWLRYYYDWSISLLNGWVWSGYWLRAFRETSNYMLKTACKAYLRIANRSKLVSHWYSAQYYQRFNPKKFFYYTGIDLY